MDLIPVKYSIKDEKKIASRISEWIYDNIFAGIFDILKISNRVYNANTDIIQNAIIQGKIYYQNGAFYSYTKRFNNEIARELENIGAKYSKYRKAYVISENKIGKVLIDDEFNIQATKKTNIDLIKIIIKDLKLASENGSPTYILANELKQFDFLLLDVQLPLQEQLANMVY